MTQKEGKKGIISINLFFLPENVTICNGFKHQYTIDSMNSFHIGIIISGL